MLYQFDQKIYADDMIYGECLLFSESLESE